MGELELVKNDEEIKSVNYEYGNIEDEPDTNN